MTIILKISCWIFAAAAASIAAPFLGRSSVIGRAARWHAREKNHIAELADLCGLHLSHLRLGPLAAMGPLTRIALGVAKGRRLKKIGAQLSDMLLLLGNALKSGLALPQAIEMASIEIAPPLGFELARLVSRMKLGRTLDESMAELALRVPTDEMGLIVGSIEVLRRTGGNLIETFATLAQTIEGRRRVEERIGTLTAQGVFQGFFLLAMPWLLGAMLFLIAPDYIEPLFSTRIGIVLAVAGVLLEAAGAVWLKKIVTIRA